MIQTVPRNFYRFSPGREIENEFFVLGRDLFHSFGALVQFSSVSQYRSVLKTLKPIEIPEAYWASIGVYTNLAISLVGMAIILHFFFGL
jgi:hypothetical protein